jgi:transcriptional regulator with XRE-family HTH domain
LEKLQVRADGDAQTVPGRETPASLGRGRSRHLRQRLAEELRTARIGGGLSAREVARRVGISHDRLDRAESADATTLTIDLVARLAPVVGLQLAASLHPNGDPVRDTAQLALLGRFRRRLHPDLKWRTEVPMPITGDLRAGDAVVEGAFGTVLVEAETRLTDLQAVERKASLKSRDLGADRLVLLLSDTPTNRRAVDLHPELRERFPVATRECLAALARGQDPGNDCLVIV